MRRSTVVRTPGGMRDGLGATQTFLVSSRVAAVVGRPPLTLNRLIGCQAVLFSSPRKKALVSNLLLGKIYP